MADYASLLEPLRQLSFECGAIALQDRQSAGLDLKPDGSIVTETDRRIETLLREELPRLTPGCAIWGEEFGYERDAGSGVWLIDPIDGTSNYAFGSPLWGISVCFAVQHRLEVGVVYLPDLDELYLGARGHGATRNDQPLPKIPPGPIKPYELCGYCGSATPRRLTQRIPGKMRFSGAFVIEAMFVASQRFRGMIGAREKLYDIAASVLINGELGADIRYADGAPLELEPLFDNTKITRPWLIFPQGSGFHDPGRS